MNWKILEWATWLEKEACLEPKPCARYSYSPQEQIVRVRNIHERAIPTALTEVGALLDSLASANDRLWPHETWPPVRFDKPMQIGAKGGHGPIRYRVKSYKPGRSVYFEFTAPKGFHGYHGFEIISVDSDSAMVRHILEMDASWGALLRWSLIFRPLHDALIEDCFDKVYIHIGLPPKRRSWSVWVKVLRWALRKAPKIR